MCVFEHVMFIACVLQVYVHVYVYWHVYVHVHGHVHAYKMLGKMIGRPFMALVPVWEPPEIALGT